MEYRPRQKARFASIENGKTHRRYAAATAHAGRADCGRTKGDKAQQFLWGRFRDVSLCGPAGAGNFEKRWDVDRAMRWGLGGSSARSR